MNYVSWEALKEVSTQDKNIEDYIRAQTIKFIKEECHRILDFVGSLEGDCRIHTYFELLEKEMSKNE